MDRSIVSEGLRRVWHYQRVLWWIFFINLLLATLGSWPQLERIEEAGNHSLQSRRLVEMFDVGSFSELSSNPEINLFAGHGASLHFAFVFFVFMLFLTGGILEAYRADRKLTAREFFEACGNYFWRWVRLLIMMGIAMLPILILASIINKQAMSLMANAAQEKAGFWLLIVGMSVCALLLMSIRLWFDMAQVRAVVEEETGMWTNAGRAFRITFGNIGTLFWIFLRISIVGWIVSALGFWIWTKMPPRHFEWTFFFLEIVILVGLGTRLWQRASEMVWYQRRFLVPVAAPVTVAPAPDPLLAIAPAPSPEQT